MKKILSTAMAIAMMASLVAVSNAAVGSFDETIYTTGSNSNLLEKFDGETVPYGKTLHMPLVDEAGTAGITAYDDVKGMSIKSNWDMNGSAIAKVEIVKKKVATDNEYYYFLGINTKDSTSIKTTDVSGKITLRKSGQDAIEEDVSFALGYPVAENPSEVMDEYHVHEFDGHTEDMLNFNGGYFMVNTVDQGDLLMKSTTRFNSEVAAKYPDANLDFVTFNNPSFNRIGEVTLYAEEDSYLYTVTSDGNLSPLKASYDEYEEAFKFKTRTLGSYVISDKELKIVASDSSSSTPDAGNGSSSGSTTTKPNPGTGAQA